MPNPSRKETLESLLREEPNDPFLHYGLAMEHVSAGDDARAVEQFRTLLSVAPDYVPAYMQGGRALLRLDQLEQARLLWQQGIVVAQQRGDLHAAEEMQGMVSSLDE